MTAYKQLLSYQISPKVKYFKNKINARTSRNISMKLE